MGGDNGCYNEYTGDLLEGVATFSGSNENYRKAGL